MIDSECPIWKAGQGFCWTPSAAWGCTDAELCAKCQAKDRTQPAAKERLCKVCQKVQITRLLWKNGLKHCSECRRYRTAKIA